MQKEVRQPSVLIVLPKGLRAMFEKFQRRYPLVKAQFLGTDGWRSGDQQTKYNLDQLQDVDVLFAGKSLVDLVISVLPNVKWIQTPEAGPDDTIQLYRENKIPRNVVLTRNGVTFKQPLSQYVIGQILSFNMEFRQHDVNQKTSSWKESKIVTDQQAEKEQNYGRIKSLPKSTVTILGLGNIGLEIARACKFLGMTVVGVTRSKVEETKRTKFVDTYRLSTDLPEALGSCDYLVNVMPSTVETCGLLSGNALSQCKNKPVFINVGRGDIIDDDSLINALRQGWLSGAVLDTFEVEPLPVVSHLWREPNIVITPHVAHGLDNEDMMDNVLEMFIANFERYTRGEILEDVVHIDRGY